jgi:hypothetical protein
MDYQINRLGSSDENFQEYADFLSSSFSISGNYSSIQKVTPAYLKWQYSENPAGKFIAYGAFYQGKMVSHFATLPVLFLINGILSKCLLALNLVTHPEHRGKGLFIKIAAKTLEDAFTLGYEYVLGVANQNSTHGLVKKLGFKLISPLDVKIGLGEIFLDEEKDYYIKSEASDDMLKWRLSNPSARYFKGRNNCILAPTGKFGIYAQLKNQAPGTSFINGLRLKNNPLKIWIGLGKIASQNGIFIDLPDKLRPVPLNLIYLNLKGPNGDFSKNDIFFELIDFDAY